MSGILFDLVGTLARFVPEQEVLLCRAAAVHGLALPPAAARRGLAAAGAWWQRETAQRPLEQRTEAERSALYRDFDGRVMAAAGFEADPGLTAAVFTTLLELGRASTLQAYDDSGPALTALQALGYPMGVVSNMDATLRVTLESLDLAPYFRVMVSSQEAGYAKPHPHIFEQAALLLGLPPQKLAYVGDQPAIDVIGARAAGMHAVLIDRAGAFPEATDCHRLTALTELAGYLGPPG